MENESKDGEGSKDNKNTLVELRRKAALLLDKYDSRVEGVNSLADKLTNPSDELKSKYDGYLGTLKNSLDQYISSLNTLQEVMIDPSSTEDSIRSAYTIANSASNDLTSVKGSIKASMAYVKRKS